MFRSIPVVHEAVRQPLCGQAASYARDTVTLGWEERVRARGRRRSDAGVEFATALTRGTVLRHGDYLLIDSLRLAVAVVALLAVIFVGMARMILDVAWGDPRPDDAAPVPESPLLLVGPATLGAIALLLGIYLPAPLQAALEQAARALSSVVP